MLNSSPGPFIQKSKENVSFDFAVALCSIGAPDIPKKFSQRSGIENMVLEPRPFLHKMVL